jgi:hypothetical protein
VPDDSEKITVPAPAPVANNGARIVGIIFCLVGIAAAVAGLVGVFARDMEPVSLLLFAGGLLLGVVGVRRVRKARKS